MPEVELILIQKGGQQVVTTLKEIEDSTAKARKELDELWKSQKKAFTSVEDAKKFDDKFKELNKTIEEGEDTIKKYKEQQKNVATTTTSTGKAVDAAKGIFTKFNAVLAGVVAVGALVVKALSTTEGGIKKLKEVTTTVKGAWDGFLRTIASGDWANLIKNIKNTSEAERELALDTLALNDILASQDLKKSYMERNLALNKLMATEAKTATERRYYTEQAIIDQKNLTATEVETQQVRVDVFENYFKTLMKSRSEEQAYIDQSIERIKDFAGNLKYWFGEFGVMQIEDMRRELKALDDEAKLGKLTNEQKIHHKELRLVVQSYEDLLALKNDMSKPGMFDNFIKEMTRMNQIISSGDLSLRYMQRSLTSMAEQGENLMNQLLEKFGKTEMAKMLGIDQLRAQRDWALKEIRDFQNKLIEAFGTLTPEQEAMLQAMGDEIQRQFLKSAFSVDPADITNMKKPIEDWLDRAIPEIKRYTLSKMDELRPAPRGGKKETFSLWEIIGIDPETEKGKEMIESIKETVGSLNESIEGVLDRQVEIATRRREYLETQIAETQHALEIELELFEAGYANNVTAKQKELIELKKLRDQALKDEEKAIKAQMLLETALQTINLITTSTELIKKLVKSLGPLGLLAAIPVIAGLFAIFASAKSRAKSITQLAEGGTGTETGVITGKSHKEGGERFLDHVEVERGERWGVLSRRASEKYGKVFDKMVYSFNRNEIPEIQSVPINQINVDNNGSNSRLDKVIAETQRMNAREGLTIIGNKRIITKGNKTRIVG